jgi:hypothetical protein
MTITWDLLILIILAIGTIYGYAIGKNKVLGILVSLYLGFIVAESGGAFLFKYLSDAAYMSNKVSITEFGVKSILLLIVTALLVFRSEVAGLDTAGSIPKIQTGLYGFLTAAVLSSSVLSFMSNAELTSLDSNFAILAVSYKPLILAVPIVVMIVSAFLKNK